MKRYELVTGIIVGTFIVCLIANYAYSRYDNQKLEKAWDEYLEDLKWQIEQQTTLQKGLVETPSVIIPLQTTDGLFDMIHELNASVVYYQTRSTALATAVDLYVFEANMVICYRLTLYRTWETVEG